MGTSKIRPFPQFFQLPMPLVIALLAFLLYLPTVSFDYTQDDAIVLSDNVYTQQGWQGIPNLWKYDTFYGFFQSEEKSQLVAGGRYRPLTPTMFAIEGAIVGLDPWVGHLMNAVFYGLLCGLLYAFLFRLFVKNQRGENWVLLAGLLFTLHPVHTEVVCNIKGRDEIMAFLLPLAAAYWLWREASFRAVIGSFLLFALGMFSKENASVFLLIAPGLFFLLGRKKLAGKTLLIFLAGFLLYFVARWIVLGPPLGGNEPGELMNNPFMEWTGNGYRRLSWIERVPTFFLGFLKYLQLTFWPWPLTHDYYPKQIPLIEWGDWRFLLSLLLVGFSGIWALLKVRTRSQWVAAAGILWFYIALLPMSNVLVNVGTFLSERFLFIPSAGAMIGFTFLLVGQKKWPKKSTRKNLQYLGFGLAFVFLLLTAFRMPAWKSNFKLFTTDVETSTRSAKVHNAVAGEYNRLAGISDSEAQQKEYGSTAAFYADSAIAIHPLYKNGYLQKGNALFYMQKYEEAMKVYEQCLEIDPGYKEARNNMGLAARAAGKLYGEQRQDFQEAVRLLEKAREYLPEDVETHRLLGVAYGSMGRGEKALGFFKKVLDARPDDPQAYYNLGAAYMQVGKLDSGEVYLNKARNLDPSLFK